MPCPQPDGGAQLETALSLEPGDQLKLEPIDGLEMNGLVAWRTGLLTGVQFTTRINCLKMLKQFSEDRSSGRSRPVRLAVKKQVEVTSELGTGTFELRDDSQKGLKLSAEGMLRAGTHVRVRLGPTMVVDGQVRWARAADVGIELRGQIAILDLGSAVSFAGSCHYAGKDDRLKIVG